MLIVGSPVSSPRARAFGLVTIGWVVACGGSSDGASDDAGAPASLTPLQAFARREALAICGELAGCCTSHGYPFSGDDCRAYLAGFFADASTFAASGTRIDESAIDACLAKATEYARACVAAPSVRWAWEDACARVLTGPKQPGEACTHDLQCAQPAGGPGHARCAQARGGGPRVCLVALPAAAGAPCEPAVPSYSSCDDESFYCPIGGTACTPKAVVGAACFGTGGCQDGYCRSLGTGPGSLCSAKAPVGGDCGSYQDGCVEDAACDLGTQRCMPRLPLGATCKNNLDCGSRRCDGHCVPEGLVASSSRCGR